MYYNKTKHEKQENNINSIKTQLANSAKIHGITMITNSKTSYFKQNLKFQVTYGHCA